ncbi:MAG: hypothetical protein WA584_13675 [Pyrinomonadaceae bacterium]
MMAKTVHLRLTGKAEKFVKDLIETGFNEREIIARALWLLETAVKTGRVALLDKEEKPLYIFSLQSLSESSMKETDEPELHEGAVKSAQEDRIIYSPFNKSMATAITEELLRKKREAEENSEEAGE